MRRSRQGMRKDDDDGKPDDPKLIGQSWIDGGAEEIRVGNGKKKRNRDEGDGEMDFKQGSNSKKVENQNDESGEESDHLSAIHGDDGRVDLKHYKMVHVEGIPDDSTEDDIRSFFNHCGTITEVFCLKFTGTDEFKGAAILTFTTEEAAERAIDLDESKMGDSFLEIHICDLFEEYLVSSMKLSQAIIKRCDAIKAARNKRQQIAEEFTKTIESMISEGFLVKFSSLWRFADSMLPFESYHMFTLIPDHEGRLAWLTWEFKRKIGFKDLPEFVQRLFNL